MHTLRLVRSLRIVQNLDIACTTPLALFCGIRDVLKLLSFRMITDTVLTEPLTALHSLTSELS